jgi:hypothetical protein
MEEFYWLMILAVVMTNAGKTKITDVLEEKVIFTR